MKKLSLIFFLSFMAASAFSQKVFFIYIQSEASQPFFVQMKEKVYSSSASGYIILSKLTDTTHTFSIGFPRSSSQYYFSVGMNKKDHGYLLKNFGDKGWGLFDRQLLTVQMGSTTPSGIAVPKAEVKKDESPFTEGLAKASDDPSLKEKPVKAAEEKKLVVVKPDVPVAVTEKPVEKPVTQVVVTPKTEEPVVAKEEPKPVAAKEEQKLVVVKEDPKPVVEVKEVPVVVEEKPVPAQKEEYAKSVVRKRSESSTTEGFGLVYIDSFPNGNSDTIRLLIPEQTTIVGVKEEQPKEEKKFLDITSAPEKKEEPKPVVAKQEPKPVVPLKEVPVATEEKPKDVTSNAPAVAITEKPVLKQNCAALAVDADFFQLRKVMAAAESDDDMISEARKACKSKCFSVQQIKNLSTMFLNEEGKYRFFDAVYNCTSEPEKYPSLEDELKDEYYIKRFKAMLRN